MAAAQTITPGLTCQTDHDTGAYGSFELYPDEAVVGIHHLGIATSVGSGDVQLTVSDGGVANLRVQESAAVSVVVFDADNNQVYP